MKTHTLSNTRKTALHVSIILIMLAAMMLILSAHTFAASSGVRGSAQIDSEDGVYLRKSSSTNSKKVALLSDNTQLVIYREVFKSKTSTSKKKVWYYVKANGKKGYVRSDNVDNVQFGTVSGEIKKKAAYRKGPGIKMKKRGNLKKGTEVSVYLDARPVSSTKGSNKTWYKVKVDGKYAYVCSSLVKITGTPAAAQQDQAAIDKVLGITSNAFSTMTNAQFESYLSNQGFPEDYKIKLRALHAQHPNWVFVAYNTGMDWKDVMKAETRYGVSLIYKSYPKSYRSTSKNSFSSYSMNAAAASADGVPAEQAPEEATDEANLTVSDATAAASEKAEDTTADPAITQTADAAAEVDETQNTAAAEAVVSVTEEASEDSDLTEDNKEEVGQAEESGEDTNQKDTSSENAENEAEKAGTKTDAPTFKEVKKALDKAAKSSEEGKDAEPVVITASAETAVYEDTGSDSVVFAELKKDAKITIKAALEVTEQEEVAESAQDNSDSGNADNTADSDNTAEDKGKAAQWYEVEFNASDAAIASSESDTDVQSASTTAASETPAEQNASTDPTADSNAAATANSSVPAYMDADQSEDSDLDAANEEAGKDADDPSDDADNSDDEEGIIIPENGIVKGYIKAEDLETINSESVITAAPAAENAEAESTAPAAENTETESAATEAENAETESTAPVAENAETVSADPEEENTESASADQESKSAEGGSGVAENVASDASAEDTSIATAAMAATDAGESDDNTVSTDNNSADDPEDGSDTSATATAKSSGLEMVSDEAMNAYYQVEPGWYNANANVVAYYLDPRNFINEDRIYMFENLGYQSEYQTASVVKKIISGTKLAGYGFTENVFMNAGAKYNISPVFLAARVRQETGGDSISVNGYKYNGTVVYNPFNIGATGSNPAKAGLKYAKSMGWTTPAKAVDGGASYLASGYISKKQNTIYFQRFNVANGLAKAGYHQYMTNIMAPYSESHITKSSYAQLGITNEPLGFIIPVYKNMPSKTSLPK